MSFSCITPGKPHGRRRQTRRGHSIERKGRQSNRLAKRAAPPPISDEAVRALLDWYQCPVPFHTVRTRFLGNIASPDMRASPMKGIAALWGGEQGSCRQRQCAKTTCIIPPERVVTEVIARLGGTVIPWCGSVQRTMISDGWCPRRTLSGRIFWQNRDIRHRIDQPINDFVT